MAAGPSQIQTVLESFFTGAVKKMIDRDQFADISDIYVQADPENGEISVYDEFEKLVDKTIIFGWVENKEEESVFNKRVAAEAKKALAVLVTNKVFDNPQFMKPLSVSLTDDTFKVIEELLFLDDETFRLDDPLLKDMDADLDDFLEKLLSDIE